MLKCLTAWVVVAVKQVTCWVQGPCFTDFRAPILNRDSGTNSQLSACIRHVATHVSSLLVCEGVPVQAESENDLMSVYETGLLFNGYSQTGSQQASCQAIVKTHQHGRPNQAMANAGSMLSTGSADSAYRTKTQDSLQPKAQHKARSARCNHACSAGILSQQASATA